MLVYKINSNGEVIIIGIDIVFIEKYLLRLPLRNSGNGGNEFFNKERHDVVATFRLIPDSRSEIVAGCSEAIRGGDAIRLPPEAAVW
jgi:hypothetical protein